MSSATRSSGRRAGRAAARRRATAARVPTAFDFTLTKDEFLDLFFEDLELPDLVKKKLSEASTPELSRAGYSVSGNPANLNLVRTMRNSMARRLSLKRPKRDELRRWSRSWRHSRASLRRNAGVALEKARDAAPAQQGDPVFRPDRCSLQPVRTDSEALCPGRDVLPDGCVRLDDRADEGSG
ncbi:MAG: DUF444 family protein [Aliidongia sp.]